MRILLVTPYFPPQQAVASLRVHGFADTWAAAGADVTVLTTVKRPDQRAWPRSIEGYHVAEIPFAIPRYLERLRGAHKRDELDHARPPEADDQREQPVRGRLGARFRRFRDQRGIYASVRMPDLTDFWVKPAVAWASARGPWDVAVSSAGPYTAHLAAMAIKTGGKAGFWVADFRDLWTDNHLHRGLFPFTVRERLLERRCLRNADLISTVSEPLAEALKRRTDAPVLVVYNGFDADEYRTDDPRRVFPQDGIIRLVFTGSLYPSGQDPSPLLVAIASLRRTERAAFERVRIVVAGTSSRQWLEAAQRTGAPEVVDARGIVGRAEAHRMQRDADALVLVDFESNVRGALTTKAFEYLHGDPPILVIGGPEETPIKRLIGAAGRGVNLGRDVVRIKEALGDLLADRPLHIAPRNDELIRSYSRQHQSRILFERIAQMVRPGAAPA